MDKYPRRFVKMSLIYLFLGIIIGLLNSFDQLKGHDLKFMHVHYNLLGFMAMMVAGVGYHILPRFNSTEIHFPSWLSIHFWLANIGLIFMTNGFHLKLLSSNEYPLLVELGIVLFIIGSFSSGIAIFMFVINMVKTLKPNAQNQENISPSTPVSKEISPSKTDNNISQKPVQTANWIRINPTMKVAELVDKYPETLEILVEEGGLTPLAMPGHIDRVRQIGITLGSAIMNHGGDLEYVISKLEEHVNTLSDTLSQSELPINKSDLIGQVLSQYPATKDIFKQFFGEGCFSCPGIDIESLEQAAQMHNADVNTLVNNLNDIVKDNEAILK